MKDLEPIDQIEFQVLVDNVTDSLSTGAKNVTLEWPALMRAGMREMAGSCQCCANHGLSLVITARRDGAQHTMQSPFGISTPKINLTGTETEKGFHLYGESDAGARSRYEIHGKRIADLSDPTR